MKKFFILFFILLISIPLMAQEKPEGIDDETWEYLLDLAVGVRKLEITYDLFLGEAKKEGLDPQIFFSTDEITAFEKAEEFASELQQYMEEQTQNKAKEKQNAWSRIQAALKGKLSITPDEILAKAKKKQGETDLEEADYKNPYVYKPLEYDVDLFMERVIEDEESLEDYNITLKQLDELVKKDWRQRAKALQTLLIREAKWDNIIDVSLIEAFLYSSILAEISTESVKQEFNIQIYNGSETPGKEKLVITANLLASMIDYFDFNTGIKNIKSGYRDPNDTPEERVEKNKRLFTYDGKGVVKYKKVVEQQIKETLRLFYDHTETNEALSYLRDLLKEGKLYFNTGTKKETSVPENTAVKKQKKSGTKGFFEKSFSKLGHSKSKLTLRLERDARERVENTSKSVFRARKDRKTEKR